MNRALHAILTVCTCLWATNAHAQRSVYAVTIGNNEAPHSESDLKTLRFADDDAVRYHELFSSMGQSTLLSVLDQRTQKRYPELVARSQLPTMDNLLRVLDSYGAELKKEVAAGKTVAMFITFSGHSGLGVDGQRYLALADGGITRDVLLDQILRRLPSIPVHLIVDACHAGAVVGIRGGFDEEVEGRRVRLASAAHDAWLQQAHLARFPNVGALVASNATQEAHEWSRIESGVFTHQILSALRGAADVNADGRIEYSEVQAFVSAANSGVMDPRAVAQVVGHPPAVDRRTPLIILDELQGAVRIEGSAENLSHFYLENDGGLRVVDAHHGQNGWISLAVPRGPRYYLRTDDHEAGFATEDTPVVALRSLHFKPRVIASRGSTDEAYRTQLFETPFSVAYYRGFVDSRGLLPVETPAAHTAQMLRTDEVTDDKSMAIVLLAGASAALVTAGVTGYLALDAKQEFDATDRQARARELADDYKRFGYASLASGLLAVAAGAAGWALWPGTASVATDASSAREMLQVRGRF